MKWYDRTGKATGEADADLGLQPEGRCGSRAALVFNRACLEPLGLFQMLFPLVASAGADQGIGERMHSGPVSWGDADRAF